MASLVSGSLRVAVVGLSGQPQANGEGVGKSCLCSRFVCPSQDEYSEDHQSTVPSSDFYGPVINGQHYLYWGRTRKVQNSGGGGLSTSPQGSDKAYEFEVIEHTLFIDDATMSAFGSGDSGRSPYVRRVTKSKFQSSGKIAYLNRDQLDDVSVGGTKYAVRSFPSAFNVDAFVVAADVSCRTLEQTEWLKAILPAIKKLKKPFVVAACKCDKLLPDCMEELETLVKGCAKGAMIVETSAREAVNVDAAFLALTSPAVRNGKQGMFQGKVAACYAEASQVVMEERRACTARFQSLLQNKLRNYQVELTWKRAESLLKEHEELHAVLATVGRDAARRMVIAHAKQLKDRQRQKQLSIYTALMEKAFGVLIPEPSFDEPFEDAMDIVRQHHSFPEFFGELESEWYSVESLANPPLENVVPVELLDSDDARQVYEDYVRKTLAAKRRAAEAASLQALAEVYQDHELPDEFPLLK